MDRKVRLFMLCFGLEPIDVSKEHIFIAIINFETTEMYLFFKQKHFEAFHFHLRKC